MNRWELGYGPLYGILPTLLFMDSALVGREMIANAQSGD